MDEFERLMSLSCRLVLQALKANEWSINFGTKGEYHTNVVALNKTNLVISSIQK